MTTHVSNPADGSARSSCKEVTTPRRQARDEKLKIPRRGTLTEPSSTGACLSSAPPTRALAPVRRESLETSQGPPGSPQVVEFQAYTGAQQGKVNGPSWSHHGSCKALRETSGKGRQSEVSSFLEYYLHGQPETTRRTASHASTVRSKEPAVFSFDLGSKPQERAPQPPIRYSGATPATQPANKGKALPNLPCPQTPTYSLFPTSIQFPVSRQSPKALSNCLCKTGSPLSPAQAGAPTNPKRPRKASLPTSKGPLAESCTPTRLLPSVVISPESTGAYRSSNLPRRPSPILEDPIILSFRSSAPVSNASTPPSSRWSGDTIARSSDSPYMKGRNSTSSTSSALYPTGSFFEDDDDEDVPLRQKMAIRFRSARAFSSSSTNTADTTLVVRENGCRAWLRRWVLCDACMG